MSAEMPEPAPENDIAEALVAGETLLEIEGLKTHFDTREGVVKAVDAVDLHIDRGEVLGLVGESGCGKSVASLSIMGLIAHPGKIVDGEILFAGKDLVKMRKNEVRKLRASTAIKATVS